MLLDSAPVFQYAFDALGTYWEIDTPSPLTPGLRYELVDCIEAFEKTYSRFRADSLVTRLATAPAGGRIEFPAADQLLFQLYDQLHAVTRGAVDPLVGRRLEQLGYDARYSLQPISGWQTTGPATDSWLRDVVRTGTTLSTQRPLVLDVGAAGKGYLVDKVTTLLQAAGMLAATVDAGGDIRHYGHAPVRVGLEHPLHPDRVVGVVELRNHAICASATTRRAWGTNLHHVLDARRGLPTTDVLATWVLAEDALTADGVATALFFVGAEALQSQFSFAAVRMLANQTVEATANFPGELFH